MAKCEMLEPMVRLILEKYPETRDDDYLLILKVLDCYVDTTNLSLSAIFTNHVDLGLPSLHSITRVRRRIQEKELYSERGKKARAKEIKEYKEYAKKI